MDHVVSTVDENGNIQYLSQGELNLMLFERINELHTEQQRMAADLAAFMLYVGSRLPEEDPDPMTILLQNIQSRLLGLQIQQGLKQIGEELGKSDG